jgi:hypothetical protein
MNFDFMTLERYEKRGEKLGSWRGLPVFALSRHHLKEKGNGAYYVLYDDDNVLVRYHEGEYKIYGVVDGYGSVNEYAHTESYYKAPAAKKAPAAETATSATEVSYTPGYDVAATVVADVVTAANVESVLANARTMTVESLLEGFNYGI